MSRPSASNEAVTAAFPTCSGPLPGNPTKAACSPFAATPVSRASGGPSGMLTLSTARSREGSKSTGVAGTLWPSTITAGAAIPAMTCALVTSVRSATTKAVPSS